MNNQTFQDLLNQHEYLKKDLFIRGFLLTDQPLATENFPFYNNWKVEQHGKYFFMAHNLTGMHCHQKANGDVFFLFGHAYNPFTMEYDEQKILAHIAEAHGTPEYMERINDVTGVFVLGDLVDGELHYLVDPSGMQSACSGTIEGHFYLTSHPQLVGDICNLQMDKFVKELTQYKWYGRVMGPYLPADLTPFKELKRIVPSIFYTYLDNGKITHKRFWPLTAHPMADQSEDYQNVIVRAADILKANMELVSKKWQHPWISLTGGIDSNTTFAAANGLYDKFESFSYLSAPKEVPDVKAAEKIAARFNVKHNVFNIPERNEDLKDFEARRELFRHNSGYIAELYDNEMRKKLYLRDHTACDVEVKSWVSETIRGYWYKHYGRSSFPKLSPKLFRNLYKIFLTNRVLVHKIDAIFAEYIDSYEYKKIPDCYPPADMHYNEVTWGSWGGRNISEMKYCFDITFIYNNRRFLDLMFQVPLAKRIADQHHLDMKKYLNKDLYDMNIRVVNLHETDNRARALNAIFIFNQILPW